VQLLHLTRSFSFSLSLSSHDVQAPTMSSSPWRSVRRYWYRGRCSCAGVSQSCGTRLQQLHQMMMRMQFASSRSSSSIESHLSRIRVICIQYGNLIVHTPRTMRTLLHEYWRDATTCVARLPRFCHRPLF
jgi:hypothetical protein